MKHFVHLLSNVINLSSPIANVIVDRKDITSSLIKSVNRLAVNNRTHLPNASICKTCTGCHPFHFILTFFKLTRRRLMLAPSCRNYQKGWIFQMLLFAKFQLKRGLTSAPSCDLLYGLRAFYYKEPSRGHPLAIL